MPKQKITKDAVVEAAFALAREGGLEAVTVKTLSEKLGCSVQPIYSYCRNMDGLRREVEALVRRFVRQYTAERLREDDMLRSMGQAWLQLAREEPHILHMFVFQRREETSSLAELYQLEADPRLAEAAAAQYGLSRTAARQLHLQMLLFTIGVGTVLATAPKLPPEELYDRQEQAFQAFFQQAKKEEL